MASCGWIGPFAGQPCTFTKGHGSAHSQLGGSEDDRYGNESRSRHRLFDTHSSKDTRTLDQKLEAMANDPGASQGERENARHLLFKRRGKAKAAPRNDDPEGTRDMSHTDFMAWLRRKQQEQEPKIIMRRYRSNTDPRAHSTGHGPPPPGMHDVGPAEG